jgi:hypothetical protein
MKAFIDALSWMATFSGLPAQAKSGLNMLVLGITALTIKLRLLLVPAGDASWTDVIFDVVGDLRAALKLASGSKATTEHRRRAPRGFNLVPPPGWDVTRLDSGQRVPQITRRLLQRADHARLGSRLL